MATTDLGKWMITNGGEYNPDTTYEQLTMVLYQNSTYITLRTVTGIIPNNDKINYILMAQGFSANALADVVAKDTYGVIGDVSGDVSAQNLVDYLTNEVVNNLLKKTSISTVQTNSDNTVPSSSLAYVMQQAITKNKEDIATANSNLEWKLNGTYKATDTCPLPEKYNELMIKIYRTSDHAYTCGVNILKAEIGKNTGNWMTGCGRDATGWDVKIVIAITNTIAINSVFINAADNKSAFSFAVYYR